MADETEDTRELREAQAEREATERQLAERAPDDIETRAHERRAEKAAYLQDKLEEREESEPD